MRKVLVLAEMKNGGLRNVSLECLSAARRVAEGGEVAAAVIEPAGNKQAVEKLAHYGADKVFLISNESLADYSTDGYTQAFSEIVREYKPDVVFTGHTAQGKDFAPRLAARMEWGLVSDVTDVMLQDGEIVFTRPIYAGKAFQKKKMNGEQAFATVRPNNIPLDQPNESHTAEIVNAAVDVKDLRTMIKEVVKKTAEGVDLSEAKIIVSGGRGVKSADGFAPLKELANVLGAAVGASRGACDADYCDYSLQIGQTGKVVTPDLYIACGISGAIQHLAGMSNSKVIVAINKDPEAPIFQVADYGIVGDLFEVVPLLTEEVKKVLQEQS